MKKKRKKPASRVQKAIVKYGYKTTQLRSALKRRPSVNKTVLRNRRRSMLDLYRDDKIRLKSLRKRCHSSFGSVDINRCSMADPLEQERARLGIEDLVGKIMVNGDYDTVYHVTSALPQHTVEFGQLHKVKPSSVRRKMEDLMREIRRDHPNAFSIGVVEVDARWVDGKPQWSGHLHTLVFNVPDSVIHKCWKFREIERLKSAYKSIVCKSTETEHALLVWANYLTKFRVYATRKNKKYDQFVRVESSEKSIPIELKKEIVDWYASYKMYDLFSFVGVPQAEVKRFYNAEMESIFRRRNKNWKKVIGGDYLW